MTNRFDYPYYLYRILIHSRKAKRWAKTHR